MRTAIRNFQIRPIIDAATLRWMVRRTLEETAESADSVSFVFVNDTIMRDVHGRYVDVPKATDVLSFPAEILIADSERDLGDVVICCDQARRQSRESGHGYLLELETLALHGLLHLLGYDHERDEGQMHALEGRLRPLLLGRWGRR